MAVGNPELDNWTIAALPLPHFFLDMVNPCMGLCKLCMCNIVSLLQVDLTSVIMLM